MVHPKCHLLKVKSKFPIGNYIKRIATRDNNEAALLLLTSLSNLTNACSDYLANVSIRKMCL